jgi:hypothetical protein
LLTEVEPAVVGEEVLWVTCFTTLDPPGEPSVLADWSTSMLGFEPPDPLTGTVVVTGLTVLGVVAGGAVVGGVLAGTVVAGAATVVGAVLPGVPWVPSEAPGAAWAEAGRAPRSRKSPARSAKDATHLRGLTASLLGLVLIWLDRPPCLGCVREGRRASAGTGEVYHGPGEDGKHRIGTFEPADQHFCPCWSPVGDQRRMLERRPAARGRLAPVPGLVIHTAGARTPELPGIAAAEEVFRPRRQRSPEGEP